MTNRELIVMLLHTDLDAQADIKETIGEIEFKPTITAKWLETGNHAVVCSNCGCRVSIKACKEMRYCFECGAKIIHTKELKK